MDQRLLSIIRVFQTSYVFSDQSQRSAVHHEVFRTVSAEASASEDGLLNFCFQRQILSLLLTVNSYYLIFRFIDNEEVGNPRCAILHSLDSLILNSGYSHGCKVICTCSIEFENVLFLYCFDYHVHSSTINRISFKRGSLRLVFQLSCCCMFI